MPSSSPTHSANILELEDVSKSYPGGVRALIDIDLNVQAGEILCLLGPSGCGKTTLLRVVAGLEQPEEGHVRFEGRDLTHVPTHQRGFGFMFQDFALFPHRNVAENIAFGLRMAKMPRPEQEARVEAMLKLVNLPGYGKRTIFELSGGERQRVALARSLAPQPQLLMLDEPLGSLDRALREELVDELRTILKRLGVTALYVTHDQDEAMALGDRMVIMQAGRIEQIGTPRQIYTHPATPFVARFLGFTNLLPASAAPEGVVTPLGLFTLDPAVAGAPPQPHDATLLLRPDAARMAPAVATKTPGFHTWDASTATVVLQGTLAAYTYHGDSYQLTVVVPQQANEAEDTTLQFEIPSYQRSSDRGTLQPVELPAIGETIQLLIFSQQATILPFSASGS